MKRISSGQFDFLQNLIDMHIHRLIVSGSICFVLLWNEYFEWFFSSETLQMSTFHLLHTKMDHYREMIKIDKPEAKLWAKR